jgi:hypothetical protein
MGPVVAAIGGPKRLSTQVRGVAEGFFVPLFFVVLGARLDVSALLDHPDLLLVTATLIVLNLVIHAPRWPRLASAPLARTCSPADQSPYPRRRGHTQARRRRRWRPRSEPP